MVDELLPLPPERTIQPCVYGVEHRHIDNARANMYALQFRGTLHFSTQASNALNEMLQAGINIKTHEDTSRGKRHIGNVTNNKKASLRKPSSSTALQIRLTVSAFECICSEVKTRAIDCRCSAHP